MFGPGGKSIARFLQIACVVFSALFLVVTFTPLVPSVATHMATDWYDGDGDVLVALGGSMLVSGTGPRATLGYDSYLRIVYTVWVLRSAKGADARLQTRNELLGSSGGAPDTAPVLREFSDHPKGADARPQTTNELLGSSGRAPDTAPVLREFSDHPKGADTRPQTTNELLGSSGGAPDTAPVLREFPDRAKGADTRPQTTNELLGSSGGAPDTAPVLREFLNGRYRWIVTSGANGLAENMAAYLIAHQVPASMILIENRSNSTAENAAFTKDLLARRHILKPGLVVAIVTSDYHTWRAQKCFAKVGLPARAIPVPDIAKRSATVTFRLTGLFILLQEWAKDIVYQVSGRI